MKRISHIYYISGRDAEDKGGVKKEAGRWAIRRTGVPFSSSLV